MSPITTNDTGLGQVDQLRHRNVARDKPLAASFRFDGESDQLS